MITNKNIILISPDSWSALPVSKHHYAIELAKNNTVYFINPPNAEKDFTEKGVFIINKYKKVKGLRFYPKWLRKLVMKVEVNSILKNNKIDIVWSFDTSRLYYLDLFNADISIAHVIDFTEHFKFKELVSSANFCFSVADCITDKMLPINSNTFKINHGYHSLDETSSQESVSVPNNVCMYFGNLSMAFIDWESLYLLAINFSEIEFWFFGSLIENNSSKNKFLALISQESNVKFKKPVTPDLVNVYLKKAKFCVAAYRHKDFGRQLDNSHKIMQYLGSGTPVFCSYTYEYRNENLFDMYDDKDNLLSKFSDFITNKTNAFSDEARQKRTEFALDNTYPKQIERIEKIIYSKLNEQ